MMLAILSQNGWLLVGACGLLVLAVVLSVRKNHKPDGEPLHPKTVAGMFAGKRQAWAEFNQLLKQPPPPDPKDALREAVREVIDEARKPKA